MNVEDWEGGRLRVYMRTPAGDVELPELADEYRPVGGGLALRKGAAVKADVVEPPELAGVELKFDLRDGRLVCVSIVSPDGHPGLGSSALRDLGSSLAGLAAEAFARHVVRLGDRNGEVVGEPVWHQPDGAFADPPQAVAAGRAGTRRGRPPLSDEHLLKIARLYREAELLGVPRTAHLARAFPHYSEVTIRNWVRAARKRGLLDPI